MKPLSITILLIVMGMPGWCQNFEWAQKAQAATTSGFAEGYGVTTDPDGNVYTTGYFSGSVDFDPGPDSFVLTSALEMTFIQKLDKHGNFVWAKQFASLPYGTAIGRGIAADSFGGIYVTGRFEYTLDVDPGPGVTTLTSSGYGTFLVKLDTAGNFRWAKSYTTSEGEWVTTDRSGNLYLAADNYITKSDSTGTLLYTKNIGGEASEVVLDSVGNIYVTGLFQDIVDFDPGPAVYNLTAFTSGSPNTFVSKLDNAGNFIWAKQIGGNADCYGNAVAVDRAGNVFLSGYFDYTIDLDPGPGTYNIVTSSLSYDFNSFIEKLDPGGNFVWGKQLACNSDIQAMSMCLDKAGNLYDAGFFRDTVDFDPGPGTFILSSGSGDGNYLLKLDNDGNFINALQFVGTASIQSDGLAMDQKSSIYLTGVVEGTYDLDPGPGVFNITTSGFEDLFVLKLNQDKYDNDTVVCCTDDYSFFGHLYNASGIYRDTLTASSGADSIVSLMLTIGAPVAGTITGPDTICGTNSITLTDTVAGGVWHVSNAKAIVAGGVITGVAYGVDTVVYMVNNTCGADSTTWRVTVKNCNDGVGQVAGAGYGLQVAPNPSTGLLNINVQEDNNEMAVVTITDMLGRTVKDMILPANKEYIVQLDVPAGLYCVNARCGDRVYTVKVVVMK